MLLRISLLFLILLQACAYHGNHAHNLADKEMYQTIPTGKIHRSCLDRFGMKLVSIIEESETQGMACLEKLKGEGSRKNIAGLQKLFESQTLSYHCDESYYRWKGVGAHASISPELNNEKLDLIYPYISVNPGYVLADSSAKGYALKEEDLRNVIFHEYFHLIGYVHNSTVEYAYTCEECCFDQDTPMSKKHRQISCKICRTDYSGIDDPAYLKDISSWSKRKSWHGVRLNLTFKVAIFKSKNAEKIWSFYFEDRTKNNLVLKNLANLLLKDKSKEWPQAVLSADKMKISPGLEDLNPLAIEAARIEKSILVDHKIQDAINAYSRLDYKILKSYLRLSKKDSPDHDAAVLIWDAILYDMDVLYFEIGFKRTKLHSQLDEEYKRVQNLWPL